MPRLIHGKCDYAFFAYDGNSSRFVHVNIKGDKEKVEEINKDLLFSLLGKLCIRMKVQDNEYVVINSDDVMDEFYNFIRRLVEARKV